MSQAIAPRSPGIDRFYHPPRQNEVVFAVNLSRVENLSHWEVIELVSRLNLKPKFEYRHHPKTGDIEIWLVLWRCFTSEPIETEFLLDEYAELAHAIEPDMAVVFAGRFPGGHRKMEADAA
ncbi:hypothetical protein P7L53_00445 [Thermoleptolyngbya sichuanensis XZ-Cy5]|uniref:hypothetical protein n=1 Tax=Thermoleptolyngbya sichuanensis TaxID=2885951 RepID=UPI00240D5371|nr:hypothetical protein [Thermoleptolyngbya sichuanensis]MDG2614700.1 hypothetical protein [Thermoleptolyngbya sichuanensis XZ-Cy5]